MRGGHARVQHLAAIRRVVDLAVGERGTNPLQHVFGIKGPRNRIGRAQRPGLHRGVMQRFGQNEQPRHVVVGLVAQLVADPLHALR
jgi:hypothetical protein